MEQYYVAWTGAPATVARCDPHPGGHQANYVRRKLIGRYRVHPDVDVQAT